MPNKPAQEKRRCATCGKRTRQWIKTAKGYECKTHDQKKGDTDMSATSSKKPHDPATDPTIKENLITMNLRCDLSDAEKAAIAAEMAEAQAELGRVESEKKAVTKEFSGRIGRLERTISLKATSYSQGWEMRDVQCVEIMDRCAGTMTVKRMDTGEKVNSRKLTDKEKVLELPLGEQK